MIYEVKYRLFDTIEIIKIITKVHLLRAMFSLQILRKNKNEIDISEKTLKKILLPRPNLSILHQRELCKL
jgi:hypothetical protein